MKFIHLCCILFCLAINPDASCQENYDIMVGHWEGEIRGSRVTFLVSLDIDKNSENSYIGAGTYHQVGIKRKYKIDFLGAMSEFGLLIEGTTHDCPIKSRLEMKLSDGLPVLEANWASACFAMATMTLQRSLSDEDYNSMEVTMSRSIYSRWLSEENGDNMLSPEETGCYRMYFDNTFPYATDKTEFIIESGSDQVIINNTRIYLEIPSYGERTKSITFSFTSTNPQEDTVSIGISSILANRKLHVETLKIPVSHVAISGDVHAAGMRIKNMEGRWLGRGGMVIYEFDSAGTFRTLKGDEGELIEDFGTWKHYTDKCSDGGEGFSLTYSQSIDGSRLKKKENYNIHSSSNNDQLHGTVKKSNGVIDGIDLLRLENSVIDEELSQNLDIWLMGKWVDDSFNSYHFKTDHKATHYNTINQSSLGNWFWTYDNTGHAPRIYLWLTLCRTFGMKKYEVKFDRSSEDSLYLINVQSSGVDIILTRDDNVEVREDITCVLPHQAILRMTFGEYENKLISKGQSLIGKNKTQVYQDIKNFISAQSK